MKIIPKKVKQLKTNKKNKRGILTINIEGTSFDYDLIGLFFEGLNHHGVAFFQNPIAILQIQHWRKDLTHPDPSIRNKAKKYLKKIGEVLAK